jgi:hypothetical protein
MIARAATPQKVNPPCAYPPIVLEMPPSVVCDLSIFYAAPSNTFSSNFKYLTMIATI